ncbi:MAG: alpha/beta hydrolase [Firmicutes bacterium]|nr:alpha/beta hydrolase [Bacillota bacterium]
MPYAMLRTGSLFFKTTDCTGGKNPRGSIFFIHGAGGDHQRWCNQLDPGFPGWCLVGIDLPGHGASGGVASNRISDYTDALKEFMEKGGLPRPYLLVGHSMGGNIALQAAISFPQLVGGLILVGSGARMPVNPQMLEQLNQGTFDTSFLKIAYSKEVDPALLQSELEKWVHASQQQLFEDFTACNSFDVSDRIETIKAPTLVLVGDQDKMTPLKSSQFLNLGINGSTLVVIPGSGHHPMLEKPLETNQAIQSFLDQRFA